MSNNSSGARGHALLVLAQAFSLVCHFFLNIALARVLGPDAFGRWGVIISLLVWIQYSFLWVLPTALARFIPHRPDEAKDLIRRVLEIQIFLGLAITCIIGGVALAANQVLEEKKLLPFLYIALLDLPASALFLHYQGVLMGYQCFERKALVMSVYALSKMGFVVAAVFIFSRLDATLWAKVLGSIVTVTAAWLLARGLGEGTTKSDIRAVLVFAMPLFVYSLCRHLTLKLDLFMVKALLEPGSEAGFYNSAVVLAQAPHFVLAALYAAVLPVVSDAASRDSGEGVSSYVSIIMSALFLILWPGYIILAASSKGVIELIFSAEYMASAVPLNILCFAFMGYTFFFFFMTVFTGLGRPGLATLLSFLLLLVDFSLQAWLIPRNGLVGAALASLLAVSIGLIAAGFYMLRLVRLKPNLLFAFLTVFVSAAIGFVLYYLDLRGVSLIPGVAFAGILFYLVMISMGQISRGDIELLLRILRRS